MLHTLYRRCINTDLEGIDRNTWKLEASKHLSYKEVDNSVLPTLLLVV